MAIDFEKIRTDNIREYGEGTRHLAFLGRLYPDRTHFIYELLQNAEDVKATSVKFLLHPDRLEFEHNGRLFNEADVRGICGVGEGTKTEDLTLIGKFGIGFKSVYAITNNPEVHSGKDHFRIEHYVRPYDCEEKTPAKGHDTLFIFPFDREDVDASMAFDELQESLKNMPTHTILFLRHIKKINIKINGDDCLTLSKHIAANHSDGTSEVVLTNGKFHKDNYLLFSKPVPFSKADLSVEISYQLSKEGTPIRPWNTSLVVFFPTEKPTNLGFLIQGPYRTTPARDNIPAKDDFNKQLIELTAELMVESLVWLRDNSYLNENTYDLLPLDETYFPSGSMFRPFYDKLMKAFSSLDLLMTSSMSSTGAIEFSNCKNIAIARGTDLRQLVDNSMLLDLTNGTIRCWLNGALTEQTKPTTYKYVKDKLGIKEWRPEDLMSRLETNFINQRNDQWLIKLYKLIQSQRLWFSNLNNQKSNPRKDVVSRVPFVDRPIVRLQDGTHVKPFKSYTCLDPSAYLSNSESIDFPRVKDTILSDPDARSFFESLGYTEPSDIEYVIEYILPNLANKDTDTSSTENHIKIARQIIKAWRDANKQQKKVINERIDRVPWLPAKNFGDQTSFHLVNQDSCYILNEDTELFLEGSMEHFYLCPELNDMTDIVIEMGVKDTIKVEHKTAYGNGFVPITYSFGWHRRGLNRFDPDARVDGLHYALVKTMGDHCIERARFIWNRILVPYKHLIRGYIESATHQNYDNSTKELTTSAMGKKVSDLAWIPDTSGTYRKANESVLQDLPDDFICDKELAEALGMMVAINDPYDELAEKIGLPKDLFRKFVERPDLLPDLVEKLRSFFEKAERKNPNHDDNATNKPEFPSHSVINSQRRADSVAESIHKAADKAYEKRERSVRISDTVVNKEAYLKNFYTNSNDEMVCQLCKKIMPFKKRNGDYYFETVELLTKELISKESESLYLALCPICSAKYKEYIKLDSSKIHTMVKQIQSSEIEEIAIETDRPETLKFNPPHYLDIRTIVTELIDPDD
ncbi:MAG TPA: hypothetical protein PLQ80_06620 [Candidatus Syntrophosphaera sp.]|nr:hypothetical protein [Candidatus Syntrophosphaera sp.]